MVADRTDAITVKAEMAPVICVDDRGGQLAVFPNGWIEYSRDRIGFWAHDIAFDEDGSGYLLSPQIAIYPSDATIYKQNLLATKWKPYDSFYEGETLDISLRMSSAEALRKFWKETTLNR